MFDIESKIFDAFNEVEDPSGDNKSHKFIDIIGISICAITSGAESYNGIVEFAEASEEWLRKYFELPKDIDVLKLVTKEKDHGRIETRKYYLVNNIS